MVEDEYKILKVHHDWCVDILKRIREVLATSNTLSSPEEKLQSVSYLVKQALKVERED